MLRILSLGNSTRHHHGAPAHQSPGRTSRLLVPAAMVSGCQRYVQLWTSKLKSFQAQTVVSVYRNSLIAQTVQIGMCHEKTNWYLQ